MSEYFKSAFSNLSSQIVGAASNASSQWSSGGDPSGDSNPQENSFVGQTVELKGQKIRIDRVIAEGTSKRLLNCVRMTLFEGLPTTVGSDMRQASLGDNQRRIVGKTSWVNQSLKYSIHSNGSLFVDNVHD